MFKAMITIGNDKDKSVCIESMVSRERVKNMAQIILGLKCNNNISTIKCNILMAKKKRKGQNQEIDN